MWNSFHQCVTHKHTNKTSVVWTYSSWPVLSQEALHVSSGHELQQDETRQDVQTDPNATNDVLMAELAAQTTKTTKVWLMAQRKTSCRRETPAAGTRCSFLLTELHLTNEVCCRGRFAVTQVIVVFSALVEGD